MSGKRFVRREFRDISEQNRIQEDVIKSEEQVRSLLAESEQSRRILPEILEDEKLAKEALRENEECFSLFMDTLPAAAFIKDGDSTTLYANRYMANIIGARSWVGKSVLNVAHKKIRVAL